MPPRANSIVHASFCVRSAFHRISIFTESSLSTQFRRIHSFRLNVSLYKHTIIVRHIIVWFVGIGLLASYVFCKRMGIPSFGYNKHTFMFVTTSPYTARSTFVELRVIASFV